MAASTEICDAAPTMPILHEILSAPPDEPMPDIPVLNIAGLNVTEKATGAHRLVIETGRQHLDGEDNCGDNGISWTNVEACPHYRVAIGGYRALLYRGQRGAAH